MKWKATLIFWQMEDDQNILAIGRDLKFTQMEDELKLLNFWMLFVDTEDAASNFFVDTLSFHFVIGVTAKNSEIGM